MDLPIVTSAQMRAAEQAAFARGVQVEALMDRAGAGIAQAVSKFFPKAGRCIVFAGKGHNAGDALVAAALLRRRGWKIEVWLAFKRDDCSELMRKKLDDLQAMTRRASALMGTSQSDLGVTLLELFTCSADDLLAAQKKLAAEAYFGTAGPLIALDGLLGVGARPPLREPIRSACRAINELRSRNAAFVFAVDVPTGLSSDEGKPGRDCVIADFTVTIGFPKSGLVVDNALDFVGRLELVQLEELRAPDKQPKAVIAAPGAFHGLLPRRPYSSYKNQYGRIGVVAGSKGFIGAAVMTTQGALLAGAGLVEVFVPEVIYDIVASAAPMEAMIKPIASYREVLKEKPDVWALGPGLGKSRAGELLELIEKARQPMIVDADGLNILSEKIAVLRRCKGKRLLTPHPGEMKRLLANEKGSRAKIATTFCRRFPVTLLLKGSRTIVAQRGRALSYNTTGNPGMATGGMGDILTGVCAGLAGQGLSLYDSARLGAWVCGRAAEIAIFDGRESEQTLLPRHVLENLGAAFKELQNSSV